MTASPLFSTFSTRLKIGSHRVYTWLRQTVLDPISHGYAAFSTRRLSTVESGSSARGGHLLDTLIGEHAVASPGQMVVLRCNRPITRDQMVLMRAELDRLETIWSQVPPGVRFLILGHELEVARVDPCVPVQDAALEAARSSSDHTDMADEQAGTQALPLCTHGYYATRCPTCLKEAT